MFDEFVKIEIGDYCMEWAVFYRNAKKIPRGLQQFIQTFPKFPRYKTTMYSADANHLRFYKQCQYFRVELYPTVDATLEFDELCKEIFSIIGPIFR
jgi:hypothetical protein